MSKIFHIWFGKLRVMFLSNAFETKHYQTSLSQSSERIYMKKGIISALFKNARYVHQLTLGREVGLLFFDKFIEHIHIYSLDIREDKA